MKSFLKKYRILSFLLILIGFGIIFGTAGYGCLYWYGVRLCKQTKPMPFDQFEIAINGLSTAPFYVLVYVKYADEKIRPVCIDVWQLMSAVENEYDIDFNKDYEVLLAKILQQKDLTFSFTKPESLQYLNQRYTMVDLALLQLLFGDSLNDEILLRGFLDSPYCWPLEGKAYILIRNGYMVQRDCFCSVFHVYRMSNQTKREEQKIEILVEETWVPVEPNML